jgi:iron complex outermembrane receptor protein
MGRSRDGFRDHSQENTERIFGDVGYRFSDHLENRFYVTLDRVDRQLPGGLTKQELKDDPQQANADAVAEDFNKKWSLVRLADKISYRNDGREFDAGLFWFHRNMEERGFFEPDFRQGITAFYSDNYGANLNFVTHDELFGRRNIFTAGFSPQFEREVSQNFENLSGHRGPVDQANTLFADPYALLGFKIGFRSKKGFSVFLEAKNLTDKRFASAVDPMADARTASDARIFHPGDGRAFYGGISWTW